MAMPPADPDAPARQVDLILARTHRRRASWTSRTNGPLPDHSRVSASHYSCTPGDSPAIISATPGSEGLRSKGAVLYA